MNWPAKGGQASVSGDWKSQTDPAAKALSLLAPGMYDAAGNLLWIGQKIDVRQCGAMCDGQYVRDATISGSVASAMSVYSPTANFKLSDVAKICGHRQIAASVGYSRVGNIVSVQDSTHCTVALNGVTTGSNNLFVWGTDDSAALALSEAKAFAYGLPIYVPTGITCSSAQWALRSGITVVGDSPLQTARNNNYTSLAYYGSSLVCLAATSISGQGGFVSQGSAADTSTDNYGWRITGMRIDAFYRAAYALGYTDTATSNRNGHLFGCWLGHGTAGAAMTTASGIIDYCMLMQNNVGNVVKVVGDASLTNCKVWGGGAGYENILVAGSDVVISKNHTWKAAGYSTATGGWLYIQPGTNSAGVSTAPANGSVTVTGNKFDTAYGHGIRINVPANTGLRAINITGNHAFNNDDTTNNSGYFVQLTVAAGGVLKALNVSDNTIQASWNDPTKGQWTGFLDGSGVAGNVYGSRVSGNLADGCNGGLNGFTPTLGANTNAYIAGNGTTVTTF